MSVKSTSKFTIEKIADSKIWLRFTCFNENKRFNENNRFTGFNENKFKKLKESADTKVAVKLCNIDANIREGSLNVIVGQSSVVEKPDKEFDIQRNCVVDLQSVKVDDNVKCNVVKVYDIAEVITKKGPTVDRQDVFVSDVSGEHTITLWGKSCNSLSEDKTYNLRVYKSNYGTVSSSSYSQIDEAIEDFTG